MVICLCVLTLQYTGDLYRMYSRPISAGIGSSSPTTLKTIDKWRMDGYHSVLIWIHYLKQTCCQTYSQKYIIYLLQKALNNEFCCITGTGGWPSRWFTFGPVLIGQCQIKAMERHLRCVSISRLQVNANFHKYEFSFHRRRTYVYMYITILYSFILNLMEGNQLYFRFIMLPFAFPNLNCRLWWFFFFLYRQKYVPGFICFVRVIPL